VGFVWASASFPDFNRTDTGFLKPRQDWSLCITEYSLIFRYGGSPNPKLDAYAVSGSFIFHCPEKEHLVAINFVDYTG